MSFEIVVEEEVAQSEFINATDKDEALKTALAMWANGEIEFKRDVAELWSATATIRRREKFDGEVVATLPDDGLCDKSGLDGVKYECYQATYIATLQIRYDLEAKSLDDAVGFSAKSSRKVASRRRDLLSRDFIRLMSAANCNSTAFTLSRNANLSDGERFHDWKQRSRGNG